MRPTPHDYAEARRLLTPMVCGGTAADGGGYHHDHDEELACCNDPSPNPPLKTRNVADVIKALLDRPRLPRAYWVETGRLVREYLVLQAGAAYSDTLRQGFVAWLKRSPGERRQYEDGNDMTRAALVDWYLKLVR
jgi:hypothetical protein